MIWKEEVLIHRGSELAAFSLQDGKQQWQSPLDSEGTTLPVIGGGRVYVAAWSPFGEPDHMPPLPSFEELLSKNDADGDGKISEKEFPLDVFVFRRPNMNVTGAAVDLKRYFGSIDTNKDGFVDGPEWQTSVKLITTVRQSSKDNGFFALEPGGRVAWREGRSVPEVPSPLYYNGRIYSVTNGGIATCLNGADGKVLYRGRLEAPGAYFASLIAASGHIYFSSGEGIVTVVRDNPESLQVVARNELGEAIFATPALAGNRIYVRSASRLLAFGE